LSLRVVSTGYWKREYLNEEKIGEEQGAGATWCSEPEKGIGGEKRKGKV